jgi:hypothetical protein
MNKGIPGRRTVMNRITARLLTIFLALMVMPFLAGCGEQPEPDVKTENEKKAGVSANDLKKETEEALETAKTYALQEKEEYQEKMEAKLKELDAQIDRMKAEAKESTEEAKAALEKRIQEMEEKREAAGKKLEEVRESSVEAWRNLKSDMDDIMSNLEKRIKEILPPYE